MGNWLGKHDFRAIAIACCALLACILIAHPFVDSAFNDDWSFANVALKLAETGRFHYNGWSAPTIVFQSIWGALFIRIFGFSFDLLRIITIPFCLGFVALAYLLARQAGLGIGLALFAALTVAVSPIVVPIAGSFMTDGYSSFFELLCLYAAVRGAQSETPNSAVRWLWILGLAGIIGGSNRQTVWAAPFFLIPYLSWTRRSERRFTIHAAITYLLCVAALIYVIRTFGQKYNATELPLASWLLVLRSNSVDSLARLTSLGLAAILLCWPALLTVTPLWKRLKWGGLSLMFVGAVPATLLLWRLLGRTMGLAPFIGNIMTAYGILDWVTNGLGARPLLLHLSARLCLTVLLLFSASFWFAVSFKVMWAKLSSAKLKLLYLLFVLPYVLLLIPGTFVGPSYDRYLLPLLPVFLILALLPVQSAGIQITAPAFLCLFGFAAYGIVTTHDYTAELAARTAAANRAEGQGIPATRLSAGLERDGWLQIQTTGSVTNLLYGQPFEMDYNQFWLWFYTRAIHPDYVAITCQPGGVPKAALFALPFRTWAPPVNRFMALVKRQDIPKP